MTRKRLLFSLAVAALLAAAGGVLLVRAGRDDRPNIILISIDTLRADHLGCYGYERATSPILDGLAAEGVLFENVVSTTSWTLPAHAALFTGLPDSVHGVTDIDRWLDRTRTTLAERLQEAGYATAGFFSGPFLHAGYGFGQGFDRYVDCSSYGDQVLASKNVGEALEIMHGRAPEDVTNDRVREKVTAWLRSRPDGPFFLFVHMWDVHYDWIPPPPFDRRFGKPYHGPVDGRGIGGFRLPEGGLAPADRQHLIDLYDGEIAWTDHTLGRILEVVAAEGLTDRTLVAVTSDHGEEFFEHGGFTHRNTLYDEVVRVPLIIRQPGGLQAGTRVKQLVSLVDVAPTLLDLAGLEPFGVARGRSLVPVMVDAFRPSPSGLAIGELWAANSDRYYFSLRHDDWKLIIDWQTRTHQVFDLRRDPGEQNPLPESEYPLPPDRFEELYRTASSEMQELARKLPPIGARDTPTIPAMKKEQLRNLGYLR